jgi:hypothetical protein
MRVWKTGERCRVTVGARTVPAEVVLASSNGESLFVHFEAMLEGHVGSAPLGWDPKLQAFVSIASGHEFVLTDPLPKASA